eukprot:tig00000158_g10190.t1
MGSNDGEPAAAPRARARDLPPASTSACAPRPAPAPAPAGSPIALLRSVTFRRPPGYTCPLRTAAVFASMQPLFRSERDVRRRTCWPACRAFDGLASIDDVTSGRGAGGCALPSVRKLSDCASHFSVEFKRPDPASWSGGLSPVLWFQFRESECNSATVELDQVWSARYILVKFIDSLDRMAELNDAHSRPNVDAEAVLFRGAALLFRPDGSFSCA